MIVYVNNYVTDLLTTPTVDPSLPLPFWDKFRLLVHGRLQLSAKQATLVLHATHDPYDLREYLELNTRGLEARLHDNGTCTCVYMCVCQSSQL